MGEGAKWGSGRGQQGELGPKRIVEGSFQRVFMFPGENLLFSCTSRGVGVELLKALFHSGFQLKLRVVNVGNPQGRQDCLGFLFL